GAFATGFLLYGIAFFYAAAGSTRLDVIAQAVARDGLTAYTLLGIALVLVGFGFKVALIPFHVWTPDVYEGAPTAVTAFLAVGVKAAAFAAFARVFVAGPASASAIPSSGSRWRSSCSRWRACRRRQGSRASSTSSAPRSTPARSGSP